MARKTGRARARGGTYHHHRLRAALIKAAREIVEERGIGALSLRATARRAGVSHAAPYHHFSGKAGLLAAVAADGFERLGTSIARQQSKSAPDDAVSQFAGVGAGYVQFAVRHPSLFRLMFRPEMTRPADHPELRQAEARAFEILSAAIGGLAKSDRLIVGDPSALALTAWSTVHGLSFLGIDQVLEETPLRAMPFSQLADAVNRAIVALLTKPPARESS